MIHLISPISNSDTVLSVSQDPSLPQDNGLIVIGTEQISYLTLYMGTLYGCTRGVNSTTPASHAAGDVITIRDYFLAPITSTGVTSIHADSSSNLTGDIQLTSGTNVTLTQVGQTITVAAASGSGISQLTGDVIAGPGSGSQAATLASSISGTKTFTGQLIGHGTATNDSAAAGYIGEYITGTLPRNGTSLVAGVAKTLTSVTLTAGDWDISASIGLGTSNTPTVGSNAAISLVTNTLPASTTIACPNASGEIMIRVVQDSSMDDITITVPTYRISISTPTTFYLVAYTNGNNAAGYGFVGARRTR